MLPAELLQYTLHSGQAYPRFFKPERGLPWAERVLTTLGTHLGKTRGELDEALLSLEGDSPDYRVVRGLAHLALAEATLEVQSPVAPEALRRETFELPAHRGYGEREAGARQNAFVNQRLAKFPCRVSYLCGNLTIFEERGIQGWMLSIRWNRGQGTSAASRCMNSSGDITMWVVPSR